MQNQPQGFDTTRALPMVRGAGCPGKYPRIRSREKNVLDIPFYRSGLSMSLRRLFAFVEVKTRNGDVTPTTLGYRQLPGFH
jgi:hypothetical protein